jgi:hypothetical protein
VGILMQHTLDVLCGAHASWLDAHWPDDEPTTDAERIYHAEALVALQTVRLRRPTVRAIDYERAEREAREEDALVEMERASEEEEREAAAELRNAQGEPL